MKIQLIATNEEPQYALSCRYRGCGEATPHRFEIPAGGVCLPLCMDHAEFLAGLGTPAPVEDLRAPAFSKIG
ncbi:MAG: hypothetical protein WC130_11210 [Kiritimatiellia bacterium]